MKLRSIIVLLVFSLATSIGFAQENTKSLYYRAVKDLIDYKVEKGWKSTLYLDAEMSIMVDLLNDKVEELNVVSINSDNRKSLYKSNGKKLTETRIFPINIIENGLKITITPYHGTLKRGKYQLLVSDGYDVIYKFDCDSGSYKFDRIERWGI